MTIKVTKSAVNIREELADLHKPSGIAGEAMLRADTPQEQFNLIGAGRRNFIINGGSKAGIISQRGSFQNYGPVTHAKYYYDRWQMFVTSMTTNISTTDEWFKAVATSTDGRFGFQQRIEDYNVFADQEFTVSARVKSNNPKARIYVSDGSGVWTTAHSGSGSEELLVVHGKAKTSPNYLYVYIMVSEPNGSETSVSIDDYIEFTNAQLELGKVATPFEHRPYGEELALCQRFYETGYVKFTTQDNDTLRNQHDWHSFMTQKRTNSPSVSITVQSQSNNVYNTVSDSRFNGFSLAWRSSSSIDHNLEVTYEAEDEL